MAATSGTWTAKLLRLVESFADESETAAEVTFTFTPSPAPLPERVARDRVVLDGSALVCPQCGESNLHQERVEVFRRREDESGDVVRLDVARAGQLPAVAPVLALEFPRETRRQLMAIGFSCEHCTLGPTLVIVQHKGSTLLRWEA